MAITTNSGVETDRLASESLRKRIERKESQEETGGGRVVWVSGNDVRLVQNVGHDWAAWA